MAVSNYSTVPDQNTQISGINIAEGCQPSGINNAIRQLMADVKQNADEQSTEFSKAMTGATADSAGTSGNVPAPQAGDQNKPLTGGGEYADSLDCDITGNAATATGLYNADGEPIDAQALANLLSKYLPLAGGTLTGNLLFATNGKTGTIYCTTDNQGLYLLSASGTSKGAYIALKGIDADKDPGTFAINAYNTDGTRRQLAGLADGRLLWKEALITTSEYIYTQYRTTTGGNLTLPSGGTWEAMWFVRSGASVYSYSCGTYAGGTTVATVASGQQGGVFAIRVS